MSSENRTEDSASTLPDPAHPELLLPLTQQLLRLHRHLARPAFRLAVVEELATAGHPDARRKAAAKLGSDHSLSEDRVEHLLRRLVADHDPGVRLAANASLRALLSRAPLLVRTQITSEWARSPRVDVRVALAAALADCDDHPGRRTALAHLLDDPTSRVRQHALMARVAQRTA